MKRRRWMYQPPKSRLCGQIALAVLTGLPLSDVIWVLGGYRGGTTTKRLVTALRGLGYGCRDRCVRLKKPPLVALAKMRTPNHKSSWHWVLVSHGRIYDGQLGDPSGTKVWWPEGTRITSYLPITSEPSLRTLRKTVAEARVLLDGIRGLCETDKQLKTQ